jgi:rubrerythrin
MDLGGTVPYQWMARDIQAETDAIAQYEAHQKVIPDVKIVALIDRILTDERAHLDLFTSFRDKFGPGGELADAPAGILRGGSVPAEVAKVIDYAAQHEYTVLLQYLFHSFVTPDHEASRELETISINEMQHLGWFSELGAELGRFPAFSRGLVHLGEATPDMLGADLEAEKRVADAYSRHADQLRGSEEHAELVETLQRALENEQYHAHMFGLMLDKVQGGEPPWQRPGSGPTQPAQERGSAEAAPSVRSPIESVAGADGEEASGEGTSQAGRKPPEFTVGSLKPGNQPRK